LPFDPAGILGIDLSTLLQGRTVIKSQILEDFWAQDCITRILKKYLKMTMAGWWYSDSKKSENLDRHE
jgi:hypothetical protein